MDNGRKAAMAEPQASYAQAIAVGAVIDAAPLRGVQLRLLAIVAAVMILEGIDIQCISFVAPAILADWQIEPSAFGAVFSVGLIGALVGAAVLGPLGDRFGRKPIIIANILFFALGTLLTPLAWDVQSLTVIRFLTSLGLGGVTPNAIALVSEYAPSRVRALFVAIVATAPLAGGMLGGLASRWLIPAFGWEGVFYAAGALSLAILVPVFTLPESARFLIAAGRRKDLVARMLGRLDRSRTYTGDEHFYLSEADRSAAGLGDLFRHGRAGITLLLWVGVAANLFMTVLLIYWLPILLHQQGMATGSAIVATSLLNGAGILGGVALAFLVDRVGAPRVIVGASFAAAAVVPLIGLVAPNVPATMLLVFLSGFLGLGSYAGFNVVAASVYPVPIRSAGIGWALSIGKAGAAAGPYAASMALSHDMPMTGIYVIAAGAGLVAAGAIVLISIRLRRIPSAEPA
ncbi:MAG: transporter, family, 4-hydroxybenzoate transporter [Sphingomonadales bacterium]|nr:transporter, family, 4-hydroxybenzoate transporter [Sphingomonadales bacterium]